MLQKVGIPSTRIDGTVPYEEQAVARAVRMGQARKVTIIQYIVKRSVEEVSRH
jgi:hypothetical protein